jgi:plastocyanin
MRNHISVWLLAAACAAAVLAVAACGSSGPSSSSGPSPTTPSTTPAGAVATNTIRIANGAVTPKDIIVARGSQVTFINNDNTSHNMTSNPHPEHTDCPEINSVGVLSAGQTRQTGNMTTNRTICGFHDHDASTVVALQGSITIQ